MYAITLINEKGGVGKTTSATTAAAGLAIRGAKVLLIDADPQGHATVSLRHKKFDGLFRLLAQDADWQTVTSYIDPTIWAGDYKPEGRLALLPGHMNTRSLPTALDHDFGYLRERLEEVEKDIDVVIFDTGPTPSVIHGIIYLACDHLVFPTQCEYLSLDGLASSTKNMVKGNRSRAMDGLQPINILGIQPTLFEQITTDHQTNMTNLRDHFGQTKVWQPIHKRTVWRNASNHGQSIFAHAPGHIAEGEAWGMVDNIMEGIRV